MSNDPTSSSKALEKTKLKQTDKLSSTILTSNQTKSIIHDKISKKRDLLSLRNLPIRKMYPENPKSEILSTQNSVAPCCNQASFGSFPKHSYLLNGLKTNSWEGVSWPLLLWFVTIPSFCLVGRSMDCLIVKSGLVHPAVRSAAQPDVRSFVFSISRLFAFLFSLAVI